jgi:hypothetical protein
MEGAARGEDARLAGDGIYLKEAASANRRLAARSASRTISFM